MKRIFKYFGAFLTAALMGTFTGCNILEPVSESADLGLGVKVFFPTKVVAGQPMTINGSGFTGVKEIVFPDGVRVTDFEIVSNEMIRVTAPAGLAAAGGKILVRTTDEEAESRLALTLGKTVVSGFSKQEGEEIGGGEQLTIYGEDLEFINKVELLDADGNPLIIEDAGFYRKGESSVIIMIPKKNIFEGKFIGKLYTYDGREFLLPELSYKPASDGGHWETVKTVIWENDDPAGHGPANWNGTYRFAGEGFETGEEIAIIPTETWEKMKSEPFYITFSHDDWFQVRVVTGWWNCQWPFGKEDDFTPNAHTDMLIDNGDGTYSIEINLKDTDLAASMDAEHLLFTGGGFTPLELYFSEDIWIDGGGHSEIVKTSVWENPDPAGIGPANWNGTYRFAGEGFETGEEIAIIPTETWEKMKSEPFYITFSHDDWFQVRVVTGWWNCQWPFGKEDDFTPNAHTDMLIDNGDGTYSIEINLKDTDLAASMDAEHLLFTGSGFTPLEIFFQEEIWVDGDGSPKEVPIWENDDPAGHGPANWNGTYRFAGEGFETGEEIAIIPTETWEKMKSEPFYITFSHDDWFQVRVVTGWWNCQWPFGKEDDFTPNAHTDMLIDNGDGTYSIEINLKDTDLAASMDAEHLLFTGSGFTPLKLYFLE